MDFYQSSHSPFLHHLFTRDDDDEPKKNFTCARPKTNDHGEVLSFGITFKSLLTYIAIACICLTLISTVILASKHLKRYTVPKEQRQIVRIIFMPLFFSFISLLSVLFYEKSIYLKPIMQ